jgi:hypothetical protein
MSEEMQVQEAPVEEKEDKEKSLADALSVFPGAPSQADIEGWKAKYGEVFCSGFSETELHVWRPVNRAEFVEMQTMLAQADVPVTQLDVEEQMVAKVVLWSSPLAVSALSQKAGSLTTLYEQIMQNSNFVSPQVAAALVIKL